MRHTIIFIEKIIRISRSLPRQRFSSDSDKSKAKKSITILKEYAVILENLVANHRNEKYLKILHAAKIPDIDDWANHVKTVLRHIDTLIGSLLKLLDRLDKILEEDFPGNDWQNAFTDFSMDLFYSGLLNDELEMEKLKKISIFKVEELKEIIKHDGHHQGMLSWIPFLDLGEEEKLIFAEQYFQELLS